MRIIIKFYLPYFMISMLLIAVYNYSYIFLNFDLDDYAGKYVDLDAHKFKLKNAKGEKVQLNDFLGSYVLLTFGFTKCTGVCPLNLHRFKAISQKISKYNQINIKYVFISFDNIRDNENELKTFLDQFDLPNSVGLLDGIETGLFVAQKYKNYIDLESDEINSDPNYQVNHNGFIYLINPRGRLSIIYLQKELKEEDVISDIIKLNNKAKS